MISGFYYYRHKGAPGTQVNNEVNKPSPVEEDLLNFLLPLPQNLVAFKLLILNLWIEFVTSVVPNTGRLSCPLNALHATSIGWVAARLVVLDLNPLNLHQITLRLYQKKWVSEADNFVATSEYTMTPLHSLLWDAKWAMPTWATYLFKFTAKYTVCKALSWQKMRTMPNMLTYIFSTLNMQPRSDQPTTTIWTRKS